MDTYEGEQEVPLSLHKYLYCEANPVNRIDYSGHWASVSIAPVHQTAIDEELNFLSETDRSELRNAQVVVDEHQAASESFMHAMRDGDPDVMHDGLVSETISQARANANWFVRKHLAAARREQRLGHRPAAMAELGQAMHTLQDSTSPMHHGFQPWYNYPGGAANPHEWCHGLGETINPGRGSWLYKSTRAAYDYFDSDTPLPRDFFEDLGSDTVGSELSGFARRRVREIPQAAANFIWAQLSLPLFGF